MSQMILDFTATLRVVKPVPMEPPATFEVPKPVDSESYLRELVEQREPMIYLYGQNPHICSIRTHSENDTGKIYSIMRGPAMEIPKDKYVFRSNHVAHDGRRAKVYISLSRRREDG